VDSCLGWLATPGERGGGIFQARAFICSIMQLTQSTLKANIAALQDYKRRVEHECSVGMGPSMYLHPSIKIITETKRKETTDTAKR